METYAASWKEVYGDILTPVGYGTGVVVCHQVNCKGVMGAGLAKQIRQKFPRVYEDYLEKCATTPSDRLLGSVQFCFAPCSAGYVIANVFAQNGYGYGRCFTDYDALAKALTRVAQMFPDSTIRLPYHMGCGLAGGDWDTVSKISQDTLVGKVRQVEIWNNTNKEEK